MRKIFITLVIALFAMSANAQLSPYREFSVFEKNHYWFEAGASYNTISTRHTDYKLGYRGGFGADIPLLYSWVSFLPSILFETKGYTSEMMRDLALCTTDMMSMYIEVPVNFSLNLPIGKKMGVQICAGPFLACGISGSYTESSDNYLGLYGTRSLEYKAFRNDDEDVNLLKNIDFGVDLGLRFIFFRYAMIKVNSEFGCINISAKEGTPAFRSRSFSASIAIRL